MSDDGAIGEDRRERMEQLFEGALALEAPQRHAFLTGACEDPSMVGEVESLLEFAQTRTGTLGGPIAALAAHVWESSVREGNRIGPYTVGSEIGHGGMGTVYMAFRDDEFRKTVALKVLSVGMHSESAVRRFRQERQILAELEHPNIARLLDGGATEDHLPYLAMEYIEGVPITKYVVERQLATADKLRLFRQLCEGVQWAHQKLVIHRDIKPGNILVTAEGIPKLLDFGIAKLTAADPQTGAAQAETGTLLRMLTPDYASPEQVRGEAASVASDVYALGALLFELLTGERAHQLRSYDPLEIAREICETAVRAPSSAGGKSLRGDLDNIVLKAMQKDPARRYPSAAALSEDIRRYLEGMPILARPDTVVYRSGKFVRRHWFSVSAVAAVILALAGGMLAALQQAHLAETRFAEGRKLAGRLFEIHDDLKNLPGTTKARQRVVSSALEYLDKLAPTAGDDAGFSWELAKAYEKTGDALGSPTQPSLGRTREAIASYRKGVALEEKLVGRGVLTPVQRESMMQSYKNLSLLYRQAREGANAVGAARRAVALSEGLRASAAAAAYGELALALDKAGDPQTALEVIPRALALQQKLAEESPRNSPERIRLAGLNLVGASLGEATLHFEDALRFADQTIAIREDRLAEEPHDALNARELLLAYLKKADILGAKDRPSMEDTGRALPYYRKGLALAEKMAADDTHNATASLDLAIAAGKTATQLEARAPREAIALYERALQAAEKLVPEGAERAGIRAAYYASVAAPQARLGHATEAREDYRKAVAILEPQARDNAQSAQASSDLADAWREWGELEGSQGNRSGARTYLLRALEPGEKAVEMAPRSFRAAWHLCLVLESLAGAQERSVEGAREAKQFRARELAIWTRWDELNPHTPYIEERRRRAR